MDKINVAFIYKPDNVFLTGNHFDNTTYDFFMNALKRNNRINVKFFPEKNKIDVSGFNKNFDLILIPNNFSDATPMLDGISSSHLPVISRVGDPHDVSKYGKLPFHKKFKINYYFNFMHSDYFYKYYPSNFNYKTIIFGCESSKYHNLPLYDNRIKNKILVSGALGNPCLKSRIINRIINPKQYGWYHYKLRTLTSKHPDVIHSRNTENANDLKEFSKILGQYAAAIAATTHYPTIKYLETTASGCLTFMEITEHNRGSYLGYEDEKTAIFINENNYKKKFSEFLNNPDDPKWKKIAEAGKKFTLENLSNDKAVDNLVNLMEDVLR